jgi:hypothetical protein
MSTLSQFFPNGKKPVQRGVIVLSSVVGSATATLSPAVDVSKTNLRMLGFNSNDTSGIDGNRFPMIVLTDSTTVTATTDTATGFSVTVSWEIEEVY